MQGAPFPVWRIGSADARQVVLLHGGFYVHDIHPLHWRLAQRLAAEAGVGVVVPLFPGAPVSTAAELVPAIADLLEQVGATALVGDSAGGGLALAVAMELRERGAPPLHATVLISPWLDIASDDPGLRRYAARDPWLGIPAAQAFGRLYRGEVPADDPRVSPLFGSLDGLGRILLFSGDRDILHADARRAVERWGDRIEFHHGPGMVHNWPILPMPEADAARAIIVDALR
ncbi:MAG TPA: alpha/beta hydrolase fold domain-containing protein [Rhodoglobus sp.]|nr:alpha/beta hydrolase fold domain-containing protein [Rhodoglobus sp.]